MLLLLTNILLSTLNNLYKTLFFILNDVSKLILFILTEVNNCLTYIINDIFCLQIPSLELNLDFNILKMEDSDDGYSHSGDSNGDDDRPKKDKGKGKATDEQMDQWEAEKQEALENEKREALKALREEQEKASKSLAEELAKEESIPLKRKASDTELNQESVSKKQNIEESSSKIKPDDSLKMTFGQKELSSNLKSAYIRKGILEDNIDRADEMRKAERPARLGNQTSVHTVPTTREEDRKWVENEIREEEKNIQGISSYMNEQWPQNSYVQNLRDAYNIDGYDTPNSESSYSSEEDEPVENIDPNKPKDSDNSALFLIFLPSLGLFNTALVLVWLDKFKNKLFGRNDTEKQKKIRALQIMFLDVLAQFVLVSVNLLCITLFQYMLSFF